MSEISGVRSARVLLDGGLQPASVAFAQGRVSAIGHHDDGPPGCTDLGDLVVMPALIDTHVHVNQPGRTEWEGFSTATAAARAGGVAVIVDMPLNSLPPTTSAAALREKRAEARPEIVVDVGFWGGIVPGSLDSVAELADAGVLGFKAFLVDSGVEEFPPIELDDLDRVLEATKAVDLPLLVHAEAPGPLAAAPAAGSDYASYLASRPPSAEVEAIEAVVAAVGRTGGRAHILHLSAGDALPVIADAKMRGLPVTAETCPHYLAIAAEDIPAAACEYKCAPPIREASNQDLLWEGLVAGTIDMIVSDHSPCPAALKQGDFGRAWGGIASLELRLPVVWTEAVRRGIDLEDVSRWTSEAPARLIGLESGRIRPGSRADFVVWDPDASFTVERDALKQRQPVSPYEGVTLRGTVVQTIVRGGFEPTLLPETS